MVVTLIKNKKSTVDHAIYIKLFSDKNFPYLTASTDDVLNTTNNDTSFPYLKKVFKYDSDIKTQEEYVLKCLNFGIYQYPLGFSIAKTDNIV